MKRNSNKQKLKDEVVFEANNGAPPIPILADNFDFLLPQLGLWKIDQQDLAKIESLQELKQLLLTRGVPQKEIEEFLAGLKNDSTRQTKKQPIPSTVNPMVEQTAQSDETKARWTLTEAMEKARKEITNYLDNSANDPGWGALALSRFMRNENQTLTTEQFENLQNLTPEERFMKLCRPEKRAETVIAFIRANPRSLLNPNNGKWLTEALVDMLEAAHFGAGLRRLPGLLPDGNRKLTSSTAKRALRLLARCEPGSPPDYPPELLAEIVGLLQVAFAPIKKTWAESGNIQTVRDKFDNEVKGFSDKQLRSFLTDKLLHAGARLAERATDMSAESFETAWKKAPEIQRIFQAEIRQ